MIDFFETQHQLVVQFHEQIVPIKHDHVRKMYTNVLLKIHLPWLLSKTSIFPDSKWNCPTFPWPWGKFIFLDNFLTRLCIVQKSFKHFLFRTLGDRAIRRDTKKHHQIHCWLSSFVYCYQHKKKVWSHYTMDLVAHHRRATTLTWCNHDL